MADQTNDPVTMPVTPPVLPGTHYTQAVRAPQLSNPPRSRIIGRGNMAPPVNPFSGLSTLQMFNIQKALNARLTLLNTNQGSPGNPGDLRAVNEVLTLVNKRMATQTTPPATLPAQPMLPSIPAKTGVRPSPLYRQPK